MKFRKEIEMTFGNFSKKYLNDPRIKIPFLKISSEFNIIKHFFPVLQFAVQNAYINFLKRILSPVRTLDQQGLLQYDKQQWL